MHPRALRDPPPSSLPHRLPHARSPAPLLPSRRRTGTAPPPPTSPTLFPASLFSLPSPATPPACPLWLPRPTRLLSRPSASGPSCLLLTLLPPCRPCAYTAALLHRPHLLAFSVHGPNGPCRHVCLSGPTVPCNGPSGDLYASPSKAKRDESSNRKASTGSTTEAVVSPRASWLLLPSFPCPPPPPPGSSSGRGGGSDGDGGDWKPNVVAAVAGAHLGRALRRRLAGLLLRSPEVRHLDVVPTIDDIWFGGSHSFATHPILGAVGNVFSASYVCSSALFNGNGSDGRYTGNGKLLSRRPRGINSKKRLWTNVLLAVNVLAYVAQIATQGKLLMWGANINSPIDRGELSRLATSNLLHAHLAFNCFSLNSTGPMVEHLTGPRRFLAVYFTSALTSSLMSYCCCQSLAVGASGAFFGLVGSYAVYMWRHKRFFGNGKESLEHIARVVILNMGMGLLSRGIDNWGHLGGLLGGVGVAMAWFLIPAWQYQHVAKDGRVVFKDRAPIL